MTKGERKLLNALHRAELAAHSAATDETDNLERLRLRSLALMLAAEVRIRKQPRVPAPQWRTISV